MVLLIFIVHLSFIKASGKDRPLKRSGALVRGGLPGNRERAVSQKTYGRRSLRTLLGFVLFPMRQAVGHRLLAAYRSFLSADGCIYKPGSYAAYADIAILCHMYTLLSVINLP